MEVLVAKYRVLIDGFYMSFVPRNHGGILFLMIFVVGREDHRLVLLVGTWLSLVARLMLE